MSVQFAPYQDSTPEIERALSPPPPEDRRSKSPGLRSPPSGRAFSPPPQQNHYQQPQYLPPPSAIGANSAPNGHAVNNDYSSPDLEGRGSGGGRYDNFQAFETSLPMRLDYEAMLAYILLPPAGGVLLLLLEHKSDYVRFHAWQSSMLFSALFVLHLVLSFSAFLSWLLFIFDLAAIAFLSTHAYRDVDTLEHYEVPFFGRIANGFVDDE